MASARRLAPSSVCVDSKESTSSSEGLPSRVAGPAMGTGAEHPASAKLARPGAAHAQASAHVSSSSISIRSGMKDGAPAGSNSVSMVSISVGTAGVLQVCLWSAGMAEMAAKEWRHGWLRSWHGYRALQSV